MATYDDDTKIQYRIKRDTIHGEFNDAIYFTKAEFEALDPAALEAQVVQRVNNWVALMNTERTRVPVAPTREELQMRKAQLENELIIINDRLR